MYVNLNYTSLHTEGAGSHGEKSDPIWTFYWVWFKPFTESDTRFKLNQLHLRVQWKNKNVNYDENVSETCRRQGLLWWFNPNLWHCPDGWPYVCYHRSQTHLIRAFLRSGTLPWNMEQTWINVNNVTVWIKLTCLDCFKSSYRAEHFDMLYCTVCVMDFWHRGALLSFRLSCDDSIWKCVWCLFYCFGPSKLMVIKRWELLRSSSAVVRIKSVELFHSGSHCKTIYSVFLYFRLRYFVYFDIEEFWYVLFDNCILIV